jgi:hypothetical protein
VDGQGPNSGVWREALAIIRIYPLATLLPAVPLGALADAPYYFIEDSPGLDQIVTFFVAAFAFYLYVAYAEEVVIEAEQGVDRITLRGMLRELLQAAPFVPRVVLAGTVAIALPSVATGLLVLPGLWLLTRWSLFAPAIRRENLGSVVALKRSKELVRGHFWMAFKTATLAFLLEEAGIHAGALVGLLEEAGIHAGALVGLLISGSETWGEWIGGTIAALLLTPLAALTTSVAYVHLAKRPEPPDHI